MDKIKTIQVGEKHVMAMTYSGKVYAWGDNQHGQVGISDPKKPKTVNAPTVVFPLQCHMSDNP
jgi:alpha-tubulin suppressor-like RCC1 family protein